MNQQGAGGLQPPGGNPQQRKLHIAHRRSPSELTPLMSESYVFAAHVNSLFNCDPLHGVIFMETC